MKPTSTGHHHKGLWILSGMIILGIWGCSQGKNDAVVKLKQLEAQHARLQDDLETAQKASDNFRKRLTQVESQRAELAKQVAELKTVVRERDDLRQQLSTRTGERDSFHSQLIQFGRELHTLAGRVEAATNGSARQITISYAD
ncbi:MAG: hypothetical protein FJ271_11745 [Planctomycetes bacterium]|nr:hypothetical protein [Planctomycetota bacterium]